MSVANPKCSSNRSNTLVPLKEFICESQSIQKDDYWLDKYSVDDDQNHQHVIKVLNSYLHETCGNEGVLGPHEFICEDMQKFLKLALPDGFSYVDSMLRSYMPKDSIFQMCCKLIKPKNVIDTKLYQLLVDTYAAKVDRQLKGTYEIVPFSAYENLITAVHNFLSGTEERTLRYHIKASQWIRLNDREIFKKLKLFWKSLNDDSDKHTKKAWAHVLSENIEHQAFFQLQHLQLQLDFVLSHRSIFTACEVTKKDSSDGDKASETYMRLFHDGHKKFLFYTDVRTELHKVSMEKSNGRPLPRHALKVETDLDIENGRYFVIPYSKYLEIVDERQVRRDAITLVNVELERTRHLVVPIISPYGTPCKPMADIFYEILSILTIELQAWWMIPPNQMGKVKDLFISQMSRFVVSDESEHLVNVSYAKEIGYFLRSEIKEIIDEGGLPSRNMKAFPEGQKTLTFNLLYDEVRRLELVASFPKISHAAFFVFAKNIGFRGPTLVTRLELTMMVQECIALCLLKNNKNPKLIHILGFCDLAADERCNFCDLTFKIPIIIPPEATATVRDVAEFEIKCDYFKEDEVIHASLLDKASGKKLVTSEMARSFVLQELLEIPMEDPSYTVKEVYSDDLRIMARKCCSKPIYFYMTSEEMIQLSAEVKKQFQATPNESRKSGVKGLLKFVNRCVEDLTAFADFSPNRVFYLRSRQGNNIGKGEEEWHVNSGELLEVVKILMDETKDSIVKRDWGLFAIQKKLWHSELGWASISLNDALEILKKFPVNPQRLSFVPEIKEFFPNLVQNGTESGQVEQAEGPSEQASLAGSAGLGKSVSEFEELKRAKDQRIRTLEQQLIESNVQNTVLKTDHAEVVANLTRKTEETNILKRRLAEQDSQRIEEFEDVAAQIAGLQKQLQEKRRKIEPSEGISQQSSPECSICLNEISESAETSQCRVCGTKWHKSCITEWMASNSTCPMCRRILSNSD